ncbi:MAG: histidine phosphatase family protein [Steroidobacteraceae bacterium]
MKRLTLVRHGHAAPADSAGSDFDRPLDRRGIREARAMSRRLAATQLAPDCIVTSPAQRTRQTADIFARTLALPAQRVVSDGRLYLAGAEQLLAALLGLGPRIGHALLVAHNPGLSDFARRLAPQLDCDELPTGAVCRLTFEAGSWPGIAFGSAREAVCDSPPRLTTLLW